MKAGFRSVQPLNLAMWALGIIVGITSVAGYLHFTGIPLLDAFISAGIATAAIHIVMGRMNDLNKMKERYENIE